MGWGCIGAILGVGALGVDPDALGGDGHALERHLGAVGMRSAAPRSGSHALGVIPGPLGVTRTQWAVCGLYAQGVHLCALGVNLYARGVRLCARGVHLCAL